MGRGAHIWEENQRRKKTWAYRTCCICMLFQRPFSRCYKKKPSHRTSNSCIFFRQFPSQTHIFPSNCSNQAHPLVSLLPERTETVRGMGQTKLAVQIHSYIYYYLYWGLSSKHEDFDVLVLSGKMIWPVKIEQFHLAVDMSHWAECFAKRVVPLAAMFV